MKLMRRRAATWLAATLALLATGLALGEACGWPFLRTPLQNALTRAAAVPVALDGRFHLRLLWRPTLRVDHLHVAGAPGVDVPFLLDARQVDLGWRWSDLWQWRRGAPLRVHRLHAEHLQAYLVRAQDGKASWQLGSPGERRPDSLELPRVGSLQVGVGQSSSTTRPGRRSCASNWTAAKASRRQRTRATA